MHLECAKIVTGTTAGVAVTNHELQPAVDAIHGLTDDIELIKMFSGQFPHRE
jgi:hypothetical protein